MTAKLWRRRRVEAREAELREISARRKAFGAALAFEPPPGVALESMPAAVGAVFSDGTRSETVVCVAAIPESIPAARARMGGEAVALFASPLALPLALAEAARNTLEYRMCSWLPVVAFRGSERCVVPAFAQFFRSGDARAIDLDPERAEPLCGTDAFLGRRSDIQEEEILYLEILRFPGGG